MRFPLWLFALLAFVACSGMVTVSHQAEAHQTEKRQAEERQAEERQAEANESQTKHVPSPAVAGHDIEPDAQALEVAAFNAGLPSLAEPPYLSTPRAALENLVDSCGAGHYERAAYSLDLSLIAVAQQADRGPTLAKKLCAVLQRRGVLDWDAAPDHPAGIVPRQENTAKDTIQLRQNILVATLPLERGRTAELRLQRVDPVNRPAVWMVSAPSVRHIDELYRVHGPNWFEKKLPSWAKQRIGQLLLWELIMAPVLLVVALGLGWGATRLMTWPLKLRLRGVEGMQRLVEKFHGPLTILVTSVLFYFALFPVLDMKGRLAKYLEPATVVVVIIAVGWIALRLVSAISNRVTSTYGDRLTDEHDHEARRMMTTASMIRRVVMFVVVVGISGIILIELRWASTLGTALLGTAGAVSVVVAVAAHRVLGNIFAGIQIAISKPVRIGDSVMFEKDWARVERIQYTHLTLRTWDHRRIIVPFTYFWQHPIENWSSVDPHLIQPIYIYVDYQADIESIRQHFVELVKNHESWDEKEDPLVLATDWNDVCVELRLTCGAATPTDAWYMHCWLREQMLRYVREQHGDHTFPRRREEDYRRKDRQSSDPQRPKFCVQ